MGKLLPFTYLAYSSRNASFCDGDAVVKVTVDSSPGTLKCHDGITYDFNIVDSSNNYVDLRNANVDGNNFPPGVTGIPSRYTYTNKDPFGYVEKHFYHQTTGTYTFNVLDNTCDGTPHTLPAPITYTIVREALDLSDSDRGPCPQAKGAPPPTPWNWGAGNPPGITYNTSCVPPVGVFGNSFINNATPNPCNQNFYVEFVVTVDNNILFPPGGTPNPPGSYPPHPWTTNNPNQTWIGANQWDGTYAISTTGPSTIADQSISFTALYSNQYIVEMIACECDFLVGTIPPISPYGSGPQYEARSIFGQTLQNCCGSAITPFNNWPYAYQNIWPHDPNSNAYAYTNLPTHPTTAVPTPWNQIPIGDTMQNNTSNLDYPNQNSLCEWCVDWWNAGSVPGTFASTPAAGAGQAHLNWGISTSQAEESCSCCPGVMANPPPWASFAIPPVSTWLL